MLVEKALLKFGFDQLRRWIEKGKDITMDHSEDPNIIKSIRKREQR